MSQPLTAPPTARQPNRTDRNRTDPRVVDGSAAGDLFDALDDDDCRAILRATGEEALSASEVSEACGLPLSTTYRKLDLLTEAGLLEERTRVRRSGNHVAEYARRVEDLVVSFDGTGELELRVHQCDPVDSLAAPASGTAER